MRYQVLHITDSRFSKTFYCDILGSVRVFASRPRQRPSDPCYLGAARDSVTLHQSSHAGDGVVGGVVVIMGDDADRLFDQITTMGLEPDMEPVDQTWGTREMYVCDPDGNTLRFVQSRR